MTDYPIVEIKDRPELLETAAGWFHSKWNVPEEAYRDSMRISMREGRAFPRWFVCLDGERIIGGAGVIDNDFHDRKDLFPNVCAVYTEKEYRGRGIAGRMLARVCDVMSASGFDTLYLITDHDSFYERCGWEFLTMVKGDGGEESRMYIHRMPERILETERLFLREMMPSDFTALYRVLGDSDIMRHYPYTFDEDRVRRWIGKNLERYRELGFGLWAVCLKETGEMIGDCGLTLQNIDGKLCPEIGYHIRKDCQRKGYAKEACIAVRDWTFAHTGFKAVYSYMKAGNTASEKTAMSYGCVKCGEYTDEEGTALIYRKFRDLPGQN